MRDYLILRQQSPLPAAIPVFSQPGFFFNNADHIGQQSTGPFCVITALNQTTGQADARCTFFVEPHRAVSPISAPFGSIEFTRNLPEAVLSALIDALIDEARSTGAPTLQLVNYPHCYAPEQAHRLTEQLLLRGFRVVSADETFFLPITSSAFKDTIDASERRRLHKCQRAGFQFAHWRCPDVDTVTSFLVQTRRQQGYNLNLSAERLSDLLRSFPEQFPVFVVTDGPTLTALTIAVRVRDDILYNFLPASDPNYRAYSPMVLLTDGLFRYCQQQHIQLLDLGTSLDANHQPKASLMRFKRNLGAQESPKLTFEKEFLTQRNGADTEVTEKEFTP